MSFPLLSDLRLQRAALKVGLLLSQAMETTTPAMPLQAWRALAFSSVEASDHHFDDGGQCLSDVGERVEILLAAPPGRDQAAMAEQGKVMADGGLRLVQILAQT